MSCAAEARSETEGGAISETEHLLARVAETTERFPRSDNVGPGSESLSDSGLHDDEDPLYWPASFKWGVVVLLFSMAFTVTFTCISLVPIANEIVADLAPDGQADKSAAVLLVTIWELGEAAGPLLLAPLSETFGRWPVFNVANVVFILAAILTASSTSVSLLISARCVNGFAVASNLLNPALVGDMMPVKSRGSALSAVQLAPLLGGAIGPAIAGTVAETYGWRGLVWCSVLLASLCEVFFLTCFRETYRAVILKRKSRRSRRDRGSAALGCTSDDPAKPQVHGAHTNSSRHSELWDAFARPAMVLSSGVLVAVSIYGAVEFTWFYIVAVTLPDILKGIYGLSPAAAGSAFVTFSLGSIACIVILHSTLDRIYVRLRERNGGRALAEFRLPLTMVGAFTLPLAALLYGWSAELRLPLPVLLLSVACIGLTLLLAALPLLSYVVDAFGLYAASALTGLMVIRCLMCTFLPLAIGPLVDRLGYGWALTVLAAGSACLAPVPVSIWSYGSVWRQYSSYSKDH